MATVIGSIMARLQLNIDNFSANMKNAEEQIKRVEDKFSGFADLGGRLSSVGTALTIGVTTPVVGLATAAVKTAATFEASMSKVQAISGATGSDLETLKNKAKEMGATTQFSASQSADAMTYMAMAGWDTTQILDGLGGVMALAAADGLDLASVSDIVTDAMTAFGMKANQAGDFADLLATASSNANTNVAMLGESFKYVAPVAGALGYSAEDTALALGLMANAGIKASQGGTALRGSLNKLVSPTTEGAKAMEKYGISITNADGTMKPLAQVMDTLREKMGGLDNATQAQVASTLFGTESMSGMLAIINTSAEDYQKLSNAIGNSEGAAEKMAATLNDNLQGKMKIMMSSIEGAAIQLGDILIPIVTKVVNKVSEWATKFNGLSESTQKVILVIAGIAAAVGPVIAIVGGLMSGFAKMNAMMETSKRVMSALKDMSGLAAVKAKLLAVAQGALNAVMAINPVVLIVAGIVALVAIFVVLWNKCEGFRNFWIQAWETIKSSAKAVWDWLKQAGASLMDSMKQSWATFTDWLKNTWSGIRDWFVSLWEGIKNVFSTVVQWVSDTFAAVFTAISTIWTGIKNFFTGLWTLIKNIFLGALLVIIDIVTGDFGKLKEDIAKIWGNIKQGFSQVWQGIKDIFIGTLTAIWEYNKVVWNGIWTGLTAIWNAIKNFFVNLWKSISESTVSAWNSFKDIISRTCSSIWEGIKSGFNALLNWLRELPGNLWRIGSDMFTKMKEGVTSTVSSVYSSVTTGVGKAVDWLKALPREAFTWGKHMLEGMIDGINATVGKVVDAVKGVGQKIRDFLGFTVPKKGPLHVYMEWMPHMMEGMRDSLKANEYKLINQAKGVAGALKDAMSFDTNLNSSYNTEGLLADSLNSSLPSTENVYYNINIEKVNANDPEDVRKLAEELEAFKRYQTI